MDQAQEQLSRKSKGLGQAAWALLRRGAISRKAMAGVVIAVGLGVGGWFANPADALGPSLQLSPTSGLASSTFNAATSGFLPGETVDLRFNGTLARTCSADSTGSCTATLTVPNQPPGQYTVTAAGATSGLSASATFTVIVPALQLSPTSGTAGSTINAAASAFLAGETVDLSFNGIIVGSCTADTTGSCTATLTVPSDSAGQYTVTANGTSSHLSASATFSIVPALSVTPSSGRPGSMFTANANGFAATETVSLSFNGTSDGSCLTNSAGNCAATVMVPSLPAGPYSVTATGGTSGLSASATFTIVPALQLSPTSGQVGSTFSAAPSVFQASETVDITFNSVLVSQCTADTSGNCTATVTVPSLPSATYTVTARGETSGLSASATFTIVPALQLSPTSGSQDSNFSAHMSGFGANDEVYLYFPGAFEGQCGADSSGQCSVIAQVPIMPAGSYIVQAYDTTDAQSASATFTLVPALSVTPGSGLPGSTFTASANGFAASEPVSLSFNGTFDGSCTTNSAGDCVANTTVAAGLSAGPYTVTATGETSGLSASATFTVTAPVLRLSPTSGQQGSTFTADVTNFVASENVAFSFGGSSTGATCTTDSSGACTAPNIVVPTQPASAYTVTASGSTGDSASATFTITSTSPSCPGGFAITSPTPLPSATHGVFYSTSLAGCGGTPPYSFKKMGKVPKGLKLNHTGLISGTPKKAGTSIFSVKMTDKAKPKHTVTQTYSITVN